MVPYLTTLGPPEPCATLPPIKQLPLLAGSTGYNKRFSATAFMNSSVITPGSTVACRFASSIFNILLKRSMDISNPPKTGKAPPAKPVPAPRGVTGIKYSLHSFNKSDISSAVRGFTTTSG